MKSAGIKILILTFLMAGLGLLAQSPYEVVDKKYKPEKRLVHDFGQILSDAERNDLERKLVAYNDSTSTQIVIVTFKNLEGYPIELLGNEIGERWGVGQKEHHNGIVIVVSDQDRKVTLRGGYGIQAKMPPTIEKLIIDREMIPSFREGNYYVGLDLAIRAIQQQLAGQYVADPKSDDDLSGWVIFALVVIFVLFFILAASSDGNGGGGGFRGSRGPIIISNSGSSSWGGGSWGGGLGGGGGFGGFGGGSFGGGGASGSW